MLRLVLLLAALLAAAPAVAHQNTVRIRVPDSRQGLCGASYPGPDWARTGTITVDREKVAEFDLADPAHCARVLEVSRDLADGGTIEIRVDVPGARNVMTNVLTARDWPRVWTVWFFNDSLSGEVAEDLPVSAAPAAPVHRNTVRIRVPDSRQGVCGANYPGPDWARTGTISVDGEKVADFDLADPETCARVVEVARDLPDGGTIEVRIDIPAAGNVMTNVLTARDWERIWTVWYFNDSLNGEVTGDLPPPQ
jgi:hypothetical protein